LELGASSEYSDLASARSLVHRISPFREGTEPFQSLAGLPLVGFLLPRTRLRRMPLLRHLLPFGRLWGTRVSTLSSVPSSGFLPLSTVPASTRLASRSCDPAVRRGLRRFAAFFHAARVPGTSLQSFPFPGSRTRSRGSSSSLRFVIDCRRRRARGIFAMLSPFEPALCPENPPGGRPWTHEPGRRFLAVASPVASARKRAARTVPIPQTLGSPVSGRHARFEALLPPGVRSATVSDLGQAETDRRCSPGILALQSSLHHGSGFGHSHRRTRGARGPVPRTSLGVQPSRLHSATRTPTLGS